MKLIPSREGCTLQYAILCIVGMVFTGTSHGGSNDQSGSVPYTLVSAPEYRGAPFDGLRFRNISGPEPRGVWDGLRWYFTRHPDKWPEWVENDAVPKPVEKIDDGSIVVTLVGHATVLIQVAGLNVLTDPVWSMRVGPFQRVGVKRVRAPAIAFSDLPTIDVVLISHNHYDHLDRPTLTALATRDNPLIVTGLKVAPEVPSERVVELDWWRARSINDSVRVTFVPAQHFSRRGAFDRDKTLWGGFVIETPAGSIYFAGDTGNGPQFEAIRKRFGPMALSLIPIGAYAPRWMMAPIHIDPSEAVQASLTLESRLSIGIHFGTFPLADDGFDAPARDLSRAVALVAPALGSDFRIVPFGQPTVVPRVATALESRPDLN